MSVAPTTSAKGMVRAGRFMRRMIAKKITSRVGPWQSIWMHAPSGEFNLTRLERVIYGPGKIKELGAEADRRGLSRVLVVTTLGGFPILDQVTGALGSRCAG